MRYFVLLLSIWVAGVYGDVENVDGQLQDLDHNFLTKSPSNYTEFEQAIENNDVVKVEELLNAPSEDSEGKKVAPVIITTDHVSYVAGNNYQEILKLLYEGNIYSGLDIAITSAASVGIVSIATVFVITATAPTALLVGGTGALLAGGLGYIGSVATGKLTEVSVKTYLINAPNSLGSSALHWAAQAGHLEVVKYLVETLDAWIFRENDEGYDAIEIAQMAGQQEVVDYLIDEKLSQDQIEQIFRYTSYLKDVRGEEDVEYYTAKAFNFNIAASVEEQEELYQYARNNAVTLSFEASSEE